MAESHREEIAKLEALYAGNPGGRVFVHLAEAYRKAGEQERARRILEEGLARHADSASGYVVLGRVLADMQIIGEAEIAFRRVLELDGGNLVALRWLGDLARQAGRNAEAATHYRELLVRNPSNEEVRDLVEIVERADPASRAAEHEPAAEPLTDWAAPSDEGAGVSGDEAAVAEPVSAFEERAVMPPQVVEPEPADITPWSAAPGNTDAVAEPEVEYGMVDIEALPGDALRIDEGQGRALERDATAAEPADMGVPDEVPASAREPGEADLVSTWDDDAETLELDELSRDDEVEPLEIHLLDPSYEASDDETADLDAELDLTDLSTLGPEEDEGEYADADFIADLSSVPREEMIGDDYAPVGAESPFILLPEAPADSAADAAPPADSERPEDAAGVQDVREPETWRGAGTLAPETEVPGQDVYSRVAAAGDVSEEVPYDEVAEEPQVADEAATADTYAAASDGLMDVQAEAPTEQGLAELAGAAERAAEWQGVVGSEPAAQEWQGVVESEPAAPEEWQPAVPREPAAPEGALKAEPAASGDAGLVTETMAVLYRTQGFHDRAADVYRALLRQRPGDERLTARLREAEEAARATESPAEDDAGEVWLRGVGAAWTGAPEQPDDATPYTWTSGTDEVEAGEPISDYLRELVAWKAGQGRWSEAGQESSPAPVRGTDTDATPPDWLMPAGDEEPSMPWADAAVEEVASWSPAQVPVEDSARWTPSAPEPPAGGTEADAQTDDRPADPWLQGAAPAEETAAAAGSPPADSGAGWTPLELERDVPAAAPASAGPAEVPPPAISASADDDDAEDEDLEMFRSWLQSLKK